jgi:hypothetical protein
MCVYMYVLTHLSFFYVRIYLDKINFVDHCFTKPTIGYSIN